MAVDQKFRDLREAANRSAAQFADALGHATTTLKQIAEQFGQNPGATDELCPSLSRWAKEMGRFAKEYVANLQAVKDYETERDAQF